ncbi:MAG: carboxypeptidase-like regulatory domain-containing protein [Bacteroidia bacterium]|nr:carboxypeptidase-like regulatory domain-containing protein [Bacteroidia bacterium]
MNPRLPLLMCLLFLFVFSAAQDLIRSRHTSYMTYIFRLENEEANRLYKGGITNVDESFFHTLLDSFPTDSGQYKRPLATGHYLFAHVQDAELKVELYSEDRLGIQLINNKQDFGLVIHDSVGNPIPDARVFLNNRKIPFSAAMKRYQLDKTHKEGLLRVEYQGNTRFFRIDHTGKGDRSFSIRRLHLYAIYYTPVRFVWLPVRAIIRTIRWRNPQGWLRKVVAIFAPYYRPDRGMEKGYMVFSQPVYRPGDTVCFKAWVAHTKGRPFRRPLDVVLRGPGYSSGINKILETLKPERKGAYVFEFVLHDSLKLTLDQNYTIELYTPQWNEVMEGQFKFEDYELAETHYLFRSDIEQHSPGRSMAFYAKGYDANDLNLLDADLDLYIFPQHIDHIATDSLFLPDTLWQHHQRLDPLGETKILLPDSLLPDANLTYEAVAIFTNSSNERHEEKRKLRYLNELTKLELNLTADTLKGDYRVQTESVVHNGQLYAFSPAGDTLLKENISLPLRIPVNPQFYRYVLTADSLSTAKNMEIESAEVSCFAYRTIDSLFVQIDNPRRLPLWYALYRKNQRLIQGTGDTWKLAMPATRSQNYFISLQYIWAGEIKEAEYKVGFSDKALKVTFEQPATIYPGQKTDISLRVTDVKGKPVPFADLTAWSMTSQFKNAGMPAVPDFSKTYPDRKMLHNFSEADPMNHLSKYAFPLDYERWKALASLDSIAWFQFLYPENGFYRHSVPTRDNTAQLVPFVVKDGRPLDVHMIFLDENLVYFSGVTALNRYTFAAQPGYHNVRLRTTEYTVQIDSLLLLPGQKQIFCIEAQPFNPRAKVSFTGKNLVPTEISLLSRMLMPVRGVSGGIPMAIAQDERYQLLQANTNNLIFGPFYPREFQYITQTDTGKHWEIFEPGFDYEFSPRRIKMRSVNMQDRIARQLTENHKPPVFTDSLLTEAEIRALWEYRVAKSDRDYYYQYVFDEPTQTTEGYGRLQLEIGRRDSLLQQILFDVNDPDFIRIYPGNERIFHQLAPGEYMLIGLRTDSSFFRIRNLHVRVNGLNYYHRLNPGIETSGSFGSQLLKQVNDRIRSKKALETQKREIKQIYRPGLVATSRPAGFNHFFSGRVKDAESGEFLAGASVIIKGTAVGTLTDYNGYFELYGPQDAVLSVSYIGFTSVEIPAENIRSEDISLTTEVNMLEEVVVVGYSGGIRKNLTGSVAIISTTQQLAGKIAGVQVNTPNDIRKAPSIDADNPSQPLTDEASDALHPGDAGNTLRRNFRDQAFWQPHLLTGSDGRATFTTTFPDDVTKWKTFAIAMGPHRQSGQGLGEIKAYKNLMAQLSLPRFLVEGDTTFVIGKVLNYTPDTVSVSTHFQVEDSTAILRRRQVLTSVLDTLLLIAPADDSLSITYSMTRENGYFDGEKRTIPLFPRGTEETQGIFLSLDRDTSFNLISNPEMTGLTIRAQASPLQLLLGEMERLRNYRYLCNEQIASKIKSLLLEVKVREMLGEKINIDRDILNMINKLQQTQDSEGLWGWWANGNYTPWISRHVLEALLAAETAGYPVKFNRQGAISELVYQLEGKNISPDYVIQNLFLLHKLGGKIDFSKHIDSLSRDTTLTPLGQFQLIELKQTLDLPYSLDTLYAQQNETLFGNLYWGKVSFHPYYNNYTTTLTAYRILRAKGGEDTRLRKIRNYLFEQKREGYWVNTYAASTILETILPEVMAESPAIQVPQLTLRGAVDAEITKFPYETDLPPGQQLSIEKKGTTPVYFSAFQSYWNPMPEAVSGDFRVSSCFLTAEGDTTESLEGGKLTTLRVKVEVNKLSEFMMLEVPVPAGCSYVGKTQNIWLNPEVHREYFRDRVSIFCEKMIPGTYTFDVTLLPRYAGVYSLNPVRIEQMYFPVFFGRNELRSVAVE